MPLESATYIADLNNANPPGSDSVSQGDDHLRLIKAVLKNQFSAFTSANLRSTQAAIDAVATDGIVTLASGSSGAPSLRFSADNTLGFYRDSNGNVAVSAGKTVRGKGAIPVGSMHTFPKAPSGLHSGGGAAAGAEYLECDGGIYNFSDFPELGAFFGATYGGNGTTTFGVPNLTDTGRFIRSRTGSVGVGTTQGNQLGSHNHTAATSITDPGHNHSLNNPAHSHGVSDPGHGHGVTDPGHSHGIHANGGGPIQTGSTFSTFVAGGANNFGATDSATNGVSVNGNTTGVTVNSATTNVTANGTTTGITAGTTVNSTGGSETRPEAFAAIICVKT